MSQSNREELILQFEEITGCETNVAKFYLNDNNWSLQDALSNFLGNQSENENISGEERKSLTEKSNNHSVNDEMEGDSFGKENKKKSKFATLNNMEKYDSNDEEGQAFYAGGSERSGQQVLGPPKQQKNFREQLTDMFRMAQETNNHDLNMSPSTSVAASRWGQGQGVRLGDQNVTAFSSIKSTKKQDEKKCLILKLWSQGFSINDGDLRLYGNSENKEFLETVMRGEIPNELLELGWMVNVDVEDHRLEEYRKCSSPKTFKGSGHTLGSPAPYVEGCFTPSQDVNPNKSNNHADNEEMARRILNINADVPITLLQIRLADGTRLSAQFNLTHTVADVVEYIRNARPNDRRNFRLVSSFPTREIMDSSLTIEEAGLKNTVVMQRFI